MRVCPDGVAIGVSGEAQIGQLPTLQRHAPPSHTISPSQSGPHEAPGVAHGAPAFGSAAGHPSRGAAQAHSGGSTGWQIGYSLPPRHELHQQRSPPS
jgi:hypothetical protein